MHDVSITRHRSTQDGDGQMRGNLTWALNQPQIQPTDLVGRVVVIVPREVPDRNLESGREVRDPRLDVDVDTSGSIRTFFTNFSIHQAPRQRGLSSTHRADKHNFHTRHEFASRLRHRLIETGDLIPAALDDPPRGRLPRICVQRDADPLRGHRFESFGGSSGDAFEIAKIRIQTEEYMSNALRSGCIPGLPSHTSTCMPGPRSKYRSVQSDLVKNLAKQLRPSAARRRRVNVRGVFVFAVSPTKVLPTHPGCYGI